MAESFTDGTWSSPEGDLEAGAYCRVCLIDLNPQGQEKVKTLCKLPVRREPGGPVHKGALRNAAGRIFQMSGVPAEEKRKAARRLVGLMRRAGIEVTSTALLRLAGEKS